MNEQISNSDVSKDERTFGMLCHLLTFSGCIIPLGNILAPLVVWLIKKDEMPFVDDQGKESINFQLTMLFAAIISGILVIVFIGIPMLVILGVYWVVAVIIATIKANEGVRYRYPYAIRLIK